MNKRITSFFLCFAMVFSMLATAVPALAATPDSTLLITPDKTEAHPGDTITYTVTLGKVPSLGMFQFELEFTEGLDYVANSAKIPNEAELKALLKIDESGELLDWTEGSKQLLYSIVDSENSIDSEIVLLKFEAKVSESSSTGKKVVTIDNYTWNEPQPSYADVPIVYDPDKSAVNVEAVSSTYTVSFHNNGGSGSMADVTGISGTYTLPVCTFTAPTGKQFKGWATSASGTVITGSTIDVTANTTLYAIWEAVPAATYTVSFHNNGGSGSMADETGVSGTYTLPVCTFTAPTGKQFKGWSTSASGAVIAGTTIEVTANTTLYAIWEDIPAATYTVSFDANGGSGSMPDETGISGTYTLPVCAFTAPAGKQFKGWSTSAGGAVIAGTTIEVTANTTLYAIWEDIPAATYTVSFDANGGSGSMADVTGVSGTYTLPACAFTAPAGKQFKGWSTSAGGTVIAGTTIEVTANTTLYAIWEDIPAATYTVSFDANGGSGSMADVTGVSGTYTLPVCTFTAPTGKQFKGWSTSASGAVIAGTTIEVTENTTLYAVWEDIPAVTYTVSFNANGGSGSMADVSDVSGTYTLPVCTFTAPAGKQFKGWATSAGGAVIAGTTIEVTADTTLYAIWEDVPAATYTVSFDANGGSGTMADVTGISGTYTLPACTFTAPTGKQFKGWATSAGGTVIAGTTIEVTANTTLYAIWENIPTGGGGGGGVTTYTITVESAKNGNVISSHKSAAKGATVTLTATPDKGYVLDALKVLDSKNQEIKLTEKGGKYTFTMPAGKVTVKGSFAAEIPEVPEIPEQIFVDVPVDAYYYEASKWAADKDIAIGTGGGKFSPDLNCSRAQAVTFLWRAAGSPAAKSGTMPFTDVETGNWYYDAVLWAAESGLIKGTSATTFSPDMNCSRAQIVTLLYRAAGSPAVSDSAAFADVAADAYYADAVAWADEKGITTGIGGGLFGSDNDCTRAQIVTFLYRYMEK